jgi:hypothetical protein
MSGIDYTVHTTYCVGANLAGQSEPLFDLSTHSVSVHQLVLTFATLPQDATSEFRALQGGHATVVHGANVF